MNEMELAAIIQAVSTIVLVLGVLVVLVKQGVPAADQALSEGIQSRLDDRRSMQLLEEMYQKHVGNQDQLIKTTLTVLEAVAALTPITSDDALVKLLEDVAEPGAPETVDDSGAVG